MPGDMYPVVCFCPFPKEKETYNILLSSITTKKQHTILYESGDITVSKNQKYGLTNVYDYSVIPRNRKYY